MPLKSSSHPASPPPSPPFSLASPLFPLCRQFFDEFPRNCSGLRQDVEKQVFTDLSSHPTVAYIKSLEAEKKSAQAKLREEVERHRALRIAHRAQARMLEKQAGRGRGAPSQQEIAFA